MKKPSDQRAFSFDFLYIIWYIASCNLFENKRKPASQKRAQQSAYGAESKKHEHKNRSTENKYAKKRIYNVDRTRDR